jgi:3-phenylpropionate/cinnamic acid dioxygenase small subunit
VTDEARDAIAALVYAYAERIDGGDFEGVAELLADAEVTAEGTDRHADGTPRTKHVTTNLVVDVDEISGTATARSYYTVLQAVPGELALQPIVAGRYRDRFERVRGSWRFAGRHLVVDLVGDLGHHLLFDLEREGS